MGPVFPRLTALVALFLVTTCSLASLSSPFYDDAAAYAEGTVDEDYYGMAASGAAIATIESGEAHKAFCAGSVVRSESPALVLTAAGCVWYWMNHESYKRFPDEDLLRVQVQNRVGGEVVALAVRGLRAHPRFTLDKKERHDVAVLSLDGGFPDKTRAVKLPGKNDLPDDQEMSHLVTHTPRVDGAPVLRRVLGEEQQNVFQVVGVVIRDILPLRYTSVGENLDFIHEAMEELIAEAQERDEEEEKKKEEEEEEKNKPAIIKGARMGHSNKTNATGAPTTSTGAPSEAGGGGPPLPGGTDTPTAAPTQAPGSEAEQLCNLVNDYREANNLTRVPFSKSLFAMGELHVQNFIFADEVSGEFDPYGKCNLHSWYDGVPNAPYTSCCYYSNHSNAECMWDKPSEITADWAFPYTGSAYENSAWGYANISLALNGWKNSPGHNAVILQTGIWESLTFNAIGCGADEQKTFYFAIFSTVTDSNPYSTITYYPTTRPTKQTLAPTQMPTTDSPTTTEPTNFPSPRPTDITQYPSEMPTTDSPTIQTATPSRSPTTDAPTKSSLSPTQMPTTDSPTMTTVTPTTSPFAFANKTKKNKTTVATENPTSAPYESPVFGTENPTSSPNAPPKNKTKNNSSAPSNTSSPTVGPTNSPFESPVFGTENPTTAPFSSQNKTKKNETKPANSSRPTMSPTKAPFESPVFGTQAPTPDNTTKNKTTRATENPTSAPYESPVFGTDNPTWSPVSNKTSKNKTTVATENPTSAPYESPVFGTENPTTAPFAKKNKTKNESAPSNTSRPTMSPTQAPFESPVFGTEPPTRSPLANDTKNKNETTVVTENPTAAPYESPVFETENPTWSPFANNKTKKNQTISETENPTSAPYESPVFETENPTAAPFAKQNKTKNESAPVSTLGPTMSPTQAPFESPVLGTDPPTRSPLANYTKKKNKTTVVTENPTSAPYESPVFETDTPTTSPFYTGGKNKTSSKNDTERPTDDPTMAPFASPIGGTEYPTTSPFAGKRDNKTSLDPTGVPSREPSVRDPTRAPIKGTRPPSKTPSRPPTKPPTFVNYTDEPTISSETPTSPPVPCLGCGTRDPSDSPSMWPTIKELTNPPSRSPNPKPTYDPTETPSRSPTVGPSKAPSKYPTTPFPTKTPTGSPTRMPIIGTRGPSTSPSKRPTESPVPYPSDEPTMGPTDEPSDSPTLKPTDEPTDEPSSEPTKSPSISPTRDPSKSPSVGPSKGPSTSPSKSPSGSPTTPAPSTSPSQDPTRMPIIGTRGPSSSPTKHPTLSPVPHPSDSPTTLPSKSPSSGPSNSPSKSPSLSPAPDPTYDPTKSPSVSPTGSPSKSPSRGPTKTPSGSPTGSPTTPAPTKSPIKAPTRNPIIGTHGPSMSPTKRPTEPPVPYPSDEPSDSPSKKPTESPTAIPSEGPSASPIADPTYDPTESPSRSPSVGPSKAPSGSPTTPFPTKTPTSSPSRAPIIGTRGPSTSPSKRPTMSPSRSPSESPSRSPSVSPTAHPTPPTKAPSRSPTDIPTVMPTVMTRSPFEGPTDSPTMSPSATTMGPTMTPTGMPTDDPTRPSVSPTSEPSGTPTVTPTRAPIIGTRGPTTSPTKNPTVSPTYGPTFSPTMAPTFVCHDTLDFCDTIDVVCDESDFAVRCPDTCGLCTPWGAFCETNGTYSFSPRRGPARGGTRVIVESECFYAGVKQVVQCQFGDQIVLADEIDDGDAYACVSPRQAWPRVVDFEVKIGGVILPFANDSASYFRFEENTCVASGVCGVPLTITGGFIDLTWDVSEFDTDNVAIMAFIWDLQRGLSREVEMEVTPNTGSRTVVLRDIPVKYDGYMTQVRFRIDSTYAFPRSSPDLGLQLGSVIMLGWDKSATAANIRDSVSEKLMTALRRGILRAGYLGDDNDLSDGLAFFDCSMACETLRSFGLDAATKYMSLEMEEEDDTMDCAGKKMREYNMNYGFMLGNKSEDSCGECMNEASVDPPRFSQLMLFPDVEGCTPDPSNADDQTASRLAPKAMTEAETLYGEGTREAQAFYQCFYACWLQTCLGDVLAEYYLEEIAPPASNCSNYTMYQYNVKYGLDLADGPDDTLCPNPKYQDKEEPQCSDSCQTAMSIGYLRLSGDDTVCDPMNVTFPVVSIDDCTPACIAGTGYYCAQVSDFAYGGAFGDPHYVMPDGTRYDFQGYGVYDLMNIAGDDITIQTYIAPYSPSAFRRGVSWTLGIAVQQGQEKAYSIVKVGNRTHPWNRIKSYFYNVTSAEFQEISGFGIYYGINFEISHNWWQAEISNADGLRLQLNAYYWLSAFIPCQLKGQLSGLLGSYDDDTSNDFTARNGSIIPQGSSGDVVYYQFGESWKVPDADIIFNGMTQPTRRRLQSWQPLTELPDVTNATEEQIEACGGIDNVECLQDVIATNDTSEANNTLAGSAGIEEVAVVPVLCSPNCANNGTCIADGVCNCNGTGFVGDRCDEEIVLGLPTEQPTDLPSGVPTLETREPTGSPILSYTFAPSMRPTIEPTLEPTVPKGPTPEPTPEKKASPAARRDGWMVLVFSLLVIVLGGGQ